MPADIEYHMMNVALTAKEWRRLCALVKLSGQEQDRAGLLGLLLGQAVAEMWEAYRENPKHAAEIAAEEGRGT